MKLAVRQKKALILLVFIGLILSLFQNVYAIGISPARTIINFEPGLETIAKYEIINNENREIYVEMHVRGDISEYIILHETSAIVPKGERKAFTYEIKLPEILEPGRHDIRIGAVESSPPSTMSGATIGARGAVESQLWIEVPYPGKYLTASLTSQDAEIGKQVEFTISLNNLGKEIISSVSGNIEIITQNNNSLGVLPTTETANFAPTTSAALKAIWAPSSRDVGTYTAKATIYYDGNTAKAETSFKIGELNLKLINVTSIPIEKEGIGKVDVLIESVWISSISSVFAEVKAAGKTAKSESITVEPWSKKIIPIYFSAEGLEAGEYPATAVVYYEGKTAEKAFILAIFEDKTMFYFMAGGSVVLAIIILVLISFIISNRRFKKRMQHAMYIPNFQQK